MRIANLVDARARGDFGQIRRRHEQVCDHGEKNGNRAHLAIGFIDRQRKDEKVHCRQQTAANHHLVNVESRVTVLVNEESSERRE